MSRPSFTVLYEDPHLLVLNKDAGLLSQGEASGDDNLVDQLREYFGRHYVGLLHRLDRNTSGSMIVAKRTKSAQRLSKAMKEGRIDRDYLALLSGKLSETQKWKDYLRKTSHNKVFAYDWSEERPHPDAKPALMEVRPLAGNDTATLCHVLLETGRPHQIRVQSKHHGHPLIGDTKYERGPSSALFHRPALHSFKLTFPHPKTDELMSFHSPLPDDIKELAKKIGLEEDLDELGTQLL